MEVIELLVGIRYVIKHVVFLGPFIFWVEGTALQHFRRGLAPLPNFFHRYGVRAR